MRAFQLAVILSLISTSLFASSVSVSCDPNSGEMPNPYPVPGLSASCSGIALDGTTVSATAQANFVLAPSSGGYNSLTFDQSALSRYYAAPDLAVGGYIGTATSQIRFAEYLVSSGPVRAGYLQMSVGGGSIKPYDGYARFSASIPSGSDLYPPVLTADGNSLSFPFSPYYNPDGTLAKLVPTTLGVPFLLSGQADMSVTADFGDGFSGTTSQMDYSFRFFEADGVTPAALSEVPEPASVLLIPCALLALLPISQRRAAIRKL